MRLFSAVLVLLAASTALASRVPPAEHASGTRVDAAKQVPLLPPLASRRKEGSAELDPARYTGRRLDLDFRRADIHRILRVIADAGQVDIVTSDDVGGEVTIKVRDVPWEQALHIVVGIAKLSYARNGSLIRIWKKAR